MMPLNFPINFKNFSKWIFAKQLFFFIFLAILFLRSQVPLQAYTPGKIKTLYNSLDPTSLSMHFAFYFLHPHTPEGKKALKDASKLLAISENSQKSLPELSKFLSENKIQDLIQLVNKNDQSEVEPLSEDVLAFIEALCSKMPNRRLKGHYAQTEQEVLSLPYYEVDLARGLFLSQFENDPNQLVKTRTYEATLDLMALQIFAKLPHKPTPKQVIKEISRFIFEEKGYRFPPHSLYAKNIDLYTFLPSVLDSRRGVCLGVSILYLCIAQRLGLNLEMITPPGHIYIRYRSPHELINIETTARGIDMDSEEYLSVDTRALQERNIKEVIGLAHFNQASVFWKDENHLKALECYYKAQLYLPDDMLLKELMGYNYLLAGKISEGKVLLSQVKDHLPDYAVSKETIAEDFFNGKTDVEGIRAVLKQVDEKRESVLEKRQSLEKIVAKYPLFRAGILALATTWLQLNRHGEALELLDKYHSLDPNEPTVEYYLTVLSTMRYDYNKAWRHLQQAEKITGQRDHHPKTLKEVRRELKKLSLEPS